MFATSPPINTDNVPFRHARMGPAEEVDWIVQVQVPESSKVILEEPCDEESSRSQINVQKLKRSEQRDSSTATTESDLTFDELEEPRTQCFSASSCFRSELKQNVGFRHEEKELIRKSYEGRRSEAISSSIMILTGPSGSGKTSLANSLRENVTQSGGYFLTGKFDFLQHPSPYQGLVSAFTEFTNIVVDRGEDEVLLMKNAILEAVGEESYILTNMVPSLLRILGNSSSNSSSGAKAEDAVSRFAFLFSRFLRAVCSRDKPLVLLLDDLHWADSCSLSLFAYFSKDPENDGFFLIGTYDDSAKVAVNPYLCEKMGAIGNCGCTRLTKLSIGDISEMEVSTLLASAFRLTSNVDLENFGRIVFEQTHGNLLQIDLFLRWLEHHQLLAYDELSKCWIVNCDEIVAACSKHDINRFCTDELLQLSQQTQDTLKVAACIGHHFDQHQLECILDFPVGDAIKEAVSKRFLVYQESRREYSFDHDIVHTTCYESIPEKDRELFHVEVGRRLWRGLGKSEVSSNLFVILSQMRIGRQLINREKERYAVATLCLHAGTELAKSSAFRVAGIYLRLGVGFLDDRSWRSNYDLCLSIFNAAAEMEMCTGNLEEMDILIDKTLLNVQRSEHKLQPYSTRIYSLGMIGRPNEAIDIAIEVLQCLGETFPSRLCKGTLFAEVNSVKKLLRGKTDKDILRLPCMVDEKKLASMSILQLIYLHAMFARPKLAPFVSLKLMKLTMKHGLSVYSSLSFSVYGMTLIGAMTDVDQAYRFGNLGLELLSKYKLDQYLPRVYASFYGCVYAWKKPVKDSLEPLLKAHRVGLQTGDIEFSSLCSNIYCFQALDSGMPLPQVLKRHEYFRDIAISNRQIGLLKLTTPCMRTIHRFMGLPYEADPSDVIIAPTDSEFVSTEICCSELRIAYMFNDFCEAEKLACSLSKQSWAMPPTIDRINAEFIVGLVSLHLASNGTQYRMNMNRAKYLLKAFKKYSVNCPSNFSDKLFLLEAEMAKVRGKNAVAFEKYTIAIALAKSSGFLFHEALCNERCARFFITTGKVLEAESYYRQSLHVYSEWGAEAKVIHLRKELGGLFVSIN